MTATYISEYWAKTDRAEGSGAAWHPLAYHSLDVTACVHALLISRPSWLRLLRTTLGPSATDDGVLSLACRLAAVHDIGKFGAFQSLSESTVHEIGVEPVYGPTSGVWRHDNVGLALMMDYSGTGPLLIASILGHEADDEDAWLHMLASASACHHGRPTEHSEAAPLLNVIGRAGRRSLEAFLDDVLPLFPVQPSLPETEEAAKRSSLMLAALINLADWLGSNKALFPYRPPGDDLATYYDHVRTVALKAVWDAGLADSTAPDATSFATLYPQIAAPSPLQVIANDLPLPTGPCLWIIDEAAGAGKTEAALTMVSRRIASGAASGLYMGLPTTVTANQQAERQKAIRRAMFGSGEEPSMIIAHAGNGAGLVLDTDADRLLWLADDRRTRLFASICVGTIDQALMAALPAKFAALRIGGLLGKVLVIDEAHSYDPYTGALLQSLLVLHGAMGGSAVIMSATLPTDLKRSLATSFARAAKLPVPSQSHIDCHAYPLITQISGQGSHVFKPARAPNAPADKRIAFVRSVAEAEQAALQAAQNGHCVLWVRNTVDQTIETGRVLADQHDDVTVFHSRFAEEDFNAISRRVLKRFGPQSTGRERAGAIVVATAVIEQSLDVDFDLLIVDLKPMEGVLQTLGRNRRHRRNANGDRISDGVDGRPAVPAIVLTPDPDDTVTASWYGRLLGHAAAVHRDPGRLWRTAKVLSEVGVVRYAETRRLVDRTYDEIALPAPSALLPGIMDAYNEAASQASRAMMLSDHWGANHGYRHSGHTWDDELIPTRDGVSLEVIFVREDAGRLEPYGGGSWYDGRMKLRPNQVDRLVVLGEDDPLGASAILACGGAKLVVGTMTPDGMEGPGYLLTARWGLEFIKDV